MSEWIRTTKRLPKSGDWPILCWVQYYSCEPKFEIATGAIIGSTRSSMPYAATHWMPLPAPPLGDGGR